MSSSRLLSRTLPGGGFVVVFCYSIRLCVLAVHDHGGGIQRKLLSRCRMNRRFLPKFGATARTHRCDTRPGHCQGTSRRAEFAFAIVLNSLDRDTLTTAESVQSRRRLLRQLQ